MVSDNYEQTTYDLFALSRIKGCALKNSKPQLRIIGGQWRGRRLPIYDAPGLRPTPDRVRETLFNWLAPNITGARCLDAFAGTGALGIEALSRGAAQVVFCERDRQLANAIQTHLNTLGGNGEVVCAGFSQTLLAGRNFDIVFLDAPFNAGLLNPAAMAIRNHLAPGHRVYFEYAKTDAPTLAPEWQILKSKQAGQVGFSLARLATAAAEGKDKPDE